MEAPPTIRPLDATRISDAARDLLDPRRRPLRHVHSVFRSSFNIETSDGLLTVAREDDGGLPNGLLIREAPDFRAIGVRAGMTVALDASTLAIPAVGISIRLSGARPWSAKLPSADGRQWASRSLHAHDVARRIARSDLKGLAGVAGASERLGQLGAAIASEDRRMAVANADGLIGLGPGLTPSGDDALVGVEAALHAVGHPLQGFLGGLMADIEDRTTIVSTTFLRHAARGEFTERLHDLLGSLLVVGDPDLVDSLERAVAWGATSGMDCLTGVLAGLDAASSARTRAAA